MGNYKSILVGAAAGAIGVMVHGQLKGVGEMPVLATRLIGAAVGISFYLGVTTYLRNKQSKQG
jgi:uncharacterized protein (DUF2236 family)